MLELVLDNYDAISGLQFDLTLPEGFDPTQTISFGRADGFSANFNRTGANTVRYFIYSLGGSQIVRGNDAIMHLPFTYPTDLDNGFYSFSASAVKLSNERMEERSSVITTIGGSVDLVRLGDLNEDKQINTVDFELMIGHILRPFSSSINKKGADFNFDGNINTTDFEMMISNMVNQK